MQGKYYLRLRSLKGELAGDLDKKENQHQTYRIAKLMAKEKKTTCSICLKDSSGKLIIGEQYMAKLMNEENGLDHDTLCEIKDPADCVRVGEVTKKVHFGFVDLEKGYLGKCYSRLCIN